MPRGNDQTDAAAELRERVAQMTGNTAVVNAQELITAHRLSSDPAVQAASLLRKDEDATAELGRAGAKEKLGVADGERLLDFAVRGDALVGVIEDADGNIFKRVVGANDDYEAPRLSAAEMSARETAIAEVQDRNALVNVQAEMAVMQQKFAENQQALLDQMAELRAQLDARAEEDARVAEEDAAAGAKLAEERRAASLANAGIDPSTGEAQAEAKPKGKAGGQQKSGE